MKLGAYLLVLECAAVALVVGVLALAPPPIVGMMGAVPSWSKALVAAIAFVTLAWQILGLLAVIADNTVLYRLYIRFNFLATVVLLIITIVFLIVSAVRHDVAFNACMNEFEQPLANDGLGVPQLTNTLHSARTTACKIITWVDVGVAGGLILLVGLVQLYMCYMQRKYGQQQRDASYGPKECVQSARLGTDAAEARWMRAYRSRHGTPVSGSRAAQAMAK